ncbi:sensor histidine kinase [Pontiella sp.]|uniref:sensor histidine kinase n=1 Tax=Pontiella sp. TaxID=2837462 RepID=UPI00356835EA
MLRFIKPLAAATLFALPAFAGPAATPAATDLSLNQLEQRLAAIDAELAGLARLTLRSGVGNIGWISNPTMTPRTPEWAQIDLPENTQIDQITLVPVLWFDAEKGPQADGFPEAFEIIAGTQDAPEGEVIASMGPEDRFLPRVAPLVIDLPSTTASWVRVNATRLSPHARGDEKSRFKLSEIMVFSNGRNVALNRPVQVSSTAGGWGAAAIYQEALVDGLTPYLMDAAGEEKSNPYLVTSSTPIPFALTIDLESSHRVDGIRLHGADVNEYIPQINPTDFGMPNSFKVTGANRSDFSDAVPLLDYHRDSIYQAGNILEWRVAETACRYVRLAVPKGAWPRDAGNEAFCISLAEIEILADGLNAAREKQVQLPKKIRSGQYLQHSLTDGRNHFGKILPIRDWMEQLARRHDLENERPGVAEELSLRYARQKSNLRRMYWLAALLVAGTVIIVLIEQVVRQRTVFRTRERIAANLHDELGANLNAIALLGDYAKNIVDHADAREQWGELVEVVDEVRNLTEETGITARLCTNLLEATGLHGDLVQEIKRSTARLLADIEHEISFENTELLDKLAPRRRIDLALFYKECLNNIVKHSGASKVAAQLTGGKKGIVLRIRDNGRGLPSVLPASLKRRARLIGGKMTAETPPEGGTCITLRIRFRHRFAAASRWSTLGKRDRKPDLRP